MNIKISTAIPALLLAFTPLVHGNETDVLREVAEQYISACAGLNHLKSAYCPRIDSPAVDQCIVEVTRLLPKKLAGKYATALNEAKKEIQINSAIGADNRFATLREINNNDIEKTCLGYSSSLHAHGQAKLEELKRLAKSKR